MSGPFIHDIDPVFAEFAGFYLWWYGASYSLGFLAGFFWLRANKSELGFDMDAVYRLITYIAIGVLVGRLMLAPGVRASRIQLTKASACSCRFWSSELPTPPQHLKWLFIK